METATAQDIQKYLLDHITEQKTLFPEERITNLGLGFALIHKFRERLPRTDERAYQKATELHNAQELANRACQILRRQKKITYDPKTKWDLAPKL